MFFFSDLVWNVFGFSSKLSCWGCQNCLLRVHSNILEKKCLKFSDVGQKTIGILWQTLRQGCQNCFPGVHRNKVSRKTFRWKPYIFLFRHWAENFQFCPKVFWLGCQNCIPPGNRIILRRSILFEFSYIFFGHWAKNLLEFVECLSTGLSKLQFSCPEAFFELNIFCKKVVEFCLSTSDFQTNNTCFLAEKYRHGCQKCILTVRWNNLRGSFLWKSFLAIFRDLAEKNFRFSSNKFLRGCQNCVLRAWGSLLKTKTFLKKFHLFSQFRSLRGAFSGICQKLLRRVVQIAFYMSSGTFREEDVLMNLFVTFGHCSNFFRF